TKCLGYGFHQGESWRKRLYFHRAAEMKQPHTQTGPNKMPSPHAGEGDARKTFLPRCPSPSSFHGVSRRRRHAYRSLHTAGRRNVAPLDAARPAEQTTVRHRPGAFLYAEAG